MRRVRTWLIAVAALLAFLALAGRSAAQLVARTEVSERERERTLIAGERAGFSVACPPGSVGVSGELVRRSGNATVLRSSPVGRRTWAFGFRNSSRSAVATVRAKATCLRLRAPRVARPFVRLGVRTVTAPTPVLGTNETLGVGLRCPSGQRAVGYGARIRDASVPARPTLGNVGAVQLSEAMPTRRGIVLVLRNTGSPAAVRVYAQCLARVAQAGSRGGARPRYRRSVILTLRSFTEGVGSLRAQGFSHACGRFGLSLSAWHALPRGRNVFLVSSFPIATAGASWTLLSLERASSAATLGLRCVDVRSAWVRLR